MRSPTTHAVTARRVAARTATTTVTLRGRRGMDTPRTDPILCTDAEHWASAARADLHERIPRSPADERVCPSTKRPRQLQALVLRPLEYCQDLKIPEPKARILEFAKTDTPASARLLSLVSEKAQVELHTRPGTDNRPQHFGQGRHGGPLPGLLPKTPPASRQLLWEAAATGRMRASGVEVRELLLWEVLPYGFVLLGGRPDFKVRRSRAPLDAADGLQARDVQPLAHRSVRSLPPRCVEQRSLLE